MQDESEISSLVLVQQEKYALASDSPRTWASYSEHLQHHGALNCSLGIVAFHFLDVSIDALGSDWVRVPVMLSGLVSFVKL